RRAVARRRRGLVRIAICDPRCAGRVRAFRGGFVVENQSESPVRFNVNVFVIGMLLAVSLAGIGASTKDPLIQWVAPGILLLLSVVGAVLWPERRDKKTSRS